MKSTSIVSVLVAACLSAGCAAHQGAHDEGMSGSANALTENPVAAQLAHRKANLVYQAIITGNMSGLPASAIAPGLPSDPCVELAKASSIAHDKIADRTFVLSKGTMTTVRGLDVSVVKVTAPASYAGVFGSLHESSNACFKLQGKDVAIGVGQFVVANTVDNGDGTSTYDIDPLTAKLTGATGSGYGVQANASSIADDGSHPNVYKWSDTCRYNNADYYAPAHCSYSNGAYNGFCGTEMAVTSAQVSGFVTDKHIYVGEEVGCYKNQALAW